MSWSALGAVAALALTACSDDPAAETPSASALPAACAPLEVRDFVATYRGDSGNSICVDRDIGLLFPQYFTVLSTRAPSANNVVWELGRCDSSLLGLEQCEHAATLEMTAPGLTVRPADWSLIYLELSGSMTRGQCEISLRAARVESFDRPIDGPAKPGPVWLVVNESGGANDRDDGFTFTVEHADAACADERYESVDGRCPEASGDVVATDPGGAVVARATVGETVPFAQSAGAYSLTALDASVQSHSDDEGLCTLDEATTRSISFYVQATP